MSALQEWVHHEEGNLYAQHLAFRRIEELQSELGELGWLFLNGILYDIQYGIHFREHRLQVYK